MLEPTLPDQSVDQGAGRIREVRPLELIGDIDASMDLSGAVIVGNYLVLGADEGHQLQILGSCEKCDCWCVERKLALAKEDQETDIEAVSYGDGYLYVAGSHSVRRRLMKPELSVRKNRERLLEVKHESPRNRLYRIPFRAKDGHLGKPESIDLSKRLRKDLLLQRFFGIPSKENGIDIEGLAYHDGRLLLGFRGPVLRGGYVPMMDLEFDRPKRYRLRFVQLEGQGVRDLVALQSGLLILSGPVNDAPGPFKLWWWDGQDQIPGKDRDLVPAIMVGEVSTAGGAKAEGLALLAQEGQSADVIVVYDTNTSAQAVRMRVDLPG